MVTYRWFRRESRTLLLIRPTLFVSTRLATWIMRGIMAKTSYGQNELIGELVLVSIGFLFLISPIIELWKRHVLSEVSMADRPRWVATLTKICQLVLLAAVITAVVGASMMSYDTSTTTINALRRVSYILSMVVVVITLLGVVYTHFHFTLNTRGTAFLVWVCAVCTICSVYRIVQIFSTNPDSAVRSHAAFYVLQAAMEVLAVVPLLAINMNAMFPGENDHSEHSSVQDVENQYKEAPTQEAPRY